MIEHIQLPDREVAKEDGRVFGRAIARRVASEIAAGDMIEARIRRIATQGAAEIGKHASGLTRSGIEPAMVLDWLKSAADAFHLELNLTAKLLGSSELAVTQH